MHRVSSGQAAEVPNQERGWPTFREGPRAETRRLA